MVLWLSMNIGLPLMPLGLVGLLGWLLQWRKSVLDVLSDGQLYFFSVAVCGVFLFDAVKAGKLDTTSYTIVLFSVLVLMSFYMASTFLVHSGAMAIYGDDARDARHRSPARKLAAVSILLTLVTIAGVCYGRSELELL